MRTAEKTSPAETKKKVIDALLRKKVGTTPLIDLAILHGESYMQDIINALATLNEAVYAQMRAQGATPCLVQQKKIIEQIILQIETNDITSEKLRLLLQRLQIECKE
ncbi:hypothetical protein KY333_05625 [Candidatus Woesearchaeota archaeon]|nr:hypothetical protein [Candidatus Woesearchaeota archaeon]MBW2994274.1 hypothetical protein [Candidatus Woesearchaeota archaeon]